MKYFWYGMASYANEEETSKVKLIANVDEGASAGKREIILPGGARGTKYTGRG